MAIKVYNVDRNTQKAQKINGEGEIGVVVHTHPPIEESRASIPFRQYFTNNGSNDMKVNGGTTPVEFEITANATEDIFIKSVNIRLGDSGAKFNQFGAITALTNGVEFIWFNQSKGEITIHDGIKDNLEFFRMGGQEPVITDLSGSAADAIIVNIDMAAVFGNRFGVKLTKSTTERLFWRINDNISGIDSFDIIGYGLKV